MPFPGILICASVFALSGCYTNSSSAIVATNTVNEMPVKKALMSMQGTIKYHSFEGGFYAFTATDGRKFSLHKLPKEARKNGLQVEVTGYLIEDIVSTTQFGDLFHVESFRVIDDSQVTMPEKEHF